jgi:hypothetical protein
VSGWIEERSGKYRARWRDPRTGKAVSRTFDLRREADRWIKERDTAKYRGEKYSPYVLWKKMLLSQLGDRAAIDVDGFNPNGHFVYLLWGSSDDCPLYVGRSANILGRLGQHLYDNSKRKRIKRVTLVRCYSARDADETETKLIKFYEPELNLSVNGVGLRKSAPPGAPPNDPSEHESPGQTL